MRTAIHNIIATAGFVYSFWYLLKEASPYIHYMYIHYSLDHLMTKYVYTNSNYHLRNLTLKNCMNADIRVTHI